MRDKVIYLDMDGVISDFTGALLKAYERPDLYDKYKTDTWPSDWWYDGELGNEDDIWNKVDSKGVGFWADMEPYHWFDELIDIVSSFDIPWYVATTPSRNPHCSGGKKAWLNKFLPRKSATAIFIKDKYLLAHENAYLIDDKDSNVIKFEEQGGNAFLFPQIWNQAKTGIPFRIPLLRGNLHHWSEESDFVSGIRNKRYESERLHRD